MSEFKNEGFENDDFELVEYLSSNYSLPKYVISGSGLGFFLDPEAYQFVRCPRGTEIVPIDLLPDERNRILVRAPFRFLLIPENEVQEIGWN